MNIFIVALPRVPLFLEIYYLCSEEKKLMLKINITAEFNFFLLFMLRYTGSLLICEIYVHDNKKTEMVL